MDTTDENNFGGILNEKYKDFFFKTPHLRSTKQTICKRNSSKTQSYKNFFIISNIVTPKEIFLNIVTLNIMTPTNGDTQKKRRIFRTSKEGDYPRSFETRFA